MLTAEIRTIADNLLFEVRTNPVYVADESGECFEALLYDALGNLEPQLALDVELCINQRLARSSGVI